MSLTYWQKFFSAAGIPSSDVQNYAIIFVDNRITESMLADLRKEHLVDMGIRRMGDIIGILKCASSWCTDSSQQTRLQQQQQQPQPQLLPAVVASVSNISSGSAAQLASNKDNSSVTSLGRIVAAVDDDRQFNFAESVKRSLASDSQAKRREENIRTTKSSSSAAAAAAAISAAAAATGAVGRIVTRGEPERAVFSRLGELSSLSSRAATAADSAAAPKSTDSSSRVSAKSSSVFNRLGGSLIASPSVTVAAGKSRTVLPAAAPATLAQKPDSIPTIIRPIRFDLVDDDDEEEEEEEEDIPDLDEEPSPPKRQALKVVDKWPSRTRASESSDSSRRQRQQQQQQQASSHRQRSREGSSGPLNYRGPLKLPATSGPSTSSFGVKRAEAHSTVEEQLRPTLYSDSMTFSKPPRDRRRDLDEELHFQRRSSGDDRRSRESASSMKRRLDDDISRVSGGRSRVANHAPALSSGGKFTRVIINSKSGR